MRHKICVVTGTRAEYGLLRRLIGKLDGDADTELKLLVTGTHLSEAYGNTQEEIREDGFPFDALPIPLGGETGAQVAEFTGEALKRFATYFAECRPEMVVILGDRYEAFAAAAAAFTEGIPIAHISGGDVTEGALDNGFRNAISMFAKLHFPGCEESAQRLIRMGAASDRVYSVGDPGVENCLNTDFMGMDELEENLGFSLDNGNFSIVTYHPVTTEVGKAFEQVRALAEALEEFPDMRFIITLANADAEGEVINAFWRETAPDHKNWLVVPSLGVRRYLSAVKLAKAVIGNSSSGIVEAPALQVPTVNVGNRQQGRPMAESVICCRPDKEEIRGALKRAFSPEFQALAKKTVSTFGNGNTSEEIARIIKEYLEGEAG